MNTTPTTRSIRLHDDINTGWQAGDVIVLTGPAVGDLFLDQGRATRLPRALASWAAETARDTLVWSLSSGARLLSPPDHTPLVTAPILGPDTAPSLAFDACVAAAAAAQNPCLVVLDHSEGVLPDSENPDLDHARLRGQLLDRATERAWIDAGHRLVLISRSGPLDRRLTASPGIRSINVGLPDRDERNQFLTAMTASSHNTALRIQLPQEQAATISGGLLLHDLARLRDANAGTITEADIVTAKEAVIERTSRGTLYLHRERPDLDRDVAGLPQIRVALAEESYAAVPTLRWILAGPPGTGKTWCSTAVGVRLGIPVVSLGAIRERWVGASEENLETALGVISAMAPVLVIVDEADQAGFGRRGNDIGGDGGSQVNAAIRGRLLEFLGDPASTNGISFVLLTNRADLLDEAVLSRFTTVPVLHPTSAEVATVMAVQARRDRIGFDLDAAADALHRNPSIMSGRDAATIAERAARLARARGRDQVTGDDIAHCLADARFRMGAAEELQALLAIRETTWSAHLPWNSATMLGEPVHIPGYLNGILSTDRRLDDAAFEARIQQLENRYVN